MLLEGKVIDFLGDSITEGVGVSDIANNRYDHILQRECNLKAVYNYGIGGTRLAHQRVPSAKARWDLCFCGRAYDLDPNADLVIVYGGINDYLHGDAPFGAMGDNTPATFCGAVWYLMNFLKETYRRQTIVFMTPAHCCLGGLRTDRLPSTDPVKRSDARAVVEYVDVILQTAKQFAIPVLDLYRTLGIDPNREEDRLNYTADGLHFNDAGHRILAQHLKDFLEAL